MKTFIRKSMTPFMMAIITCAMLSCNKDNPNHLPSVSPADYVGKIDGYGSSDEIAPANLIAYWNFDGNETETISGINPTKTSNDSYQDNGIKGKGLKLNSGYLYYASAIPKLNDTSLKSFSVSEWVQIVNNGSTPTMTFDLARPGQFWGNINFLLETGQKQPADTLNLIVHPNYADRFGGTQDNLNASWLSTYSSPTIGANKWVNLVITYDYVQNIFQIWADGKKIGTTDYQQRGNAYFKNTVPNEVIIGGWYNNIPGKTVSTDTWTVPMVGTIDEIRVYNTVLDAALIPTLYKLGKAGK